MIYVCVEPTYSDLCMQLCMRGADLAVILRLWCSVNIACTAHRHHACRCRWCSLSIIGVGRVGGLCSVEAC